MNDQVDPVAERLFAEVAVADETLVASSEATPPFSVFRLVMFGIGVSITGWVLVQALINGQAPDPQTGATQVWEYGALVAFFVLFLYGLVNTIQDNRARQLTQRLLLTSARVVFVADKAPGQAAWIMRGSGIEMAKGRGGVLALGRDFTRVAMLLAPKVPVPGVTNALVLRLDAASQMRFERVLDMVRPAAVDEDEG